MVRGRRCGSSRVLGAAAVAIALAGGGRTPDAWADDPDDPPARPAPAAPPAPPADPYPRALNARPLLLPAGMLAAELWLVADHYLNGDVDDTELDVEPSVRAGLGPVEVEGGLALAAAQFDHSDPPLAPPARLQRVDLAARYRLPGDGYVGVGLTAITPGEPYTGYVSALRVRYKAHPPTNTAPLLGAAIGLRSYHDATGAVTEDRRYLFVEADGRAQTQPWARLGVEAKLGIHYVRRLGYEPAIGEKIGFLSVDVGLALVVAVSDQLDLQASADFENLGTKLYAVGLAVHGGR